MLGHEITFPAPTADERKTGIHHVIQCETCHDPDEYGVGSTRFTGMSKDEAWDLLSDHLDAYFEGEN